MFSVHEGGMVLTPCVLPKSRPRLSHLPTNQSKSGVLEGWGSLLFLQHQVNGKVQARPLQAVMRRLGSIPGCFLPFQYRTPHGAQGYLVFRTSVPRANVVRLGEAEGGTETRGRPVGDAFMPLKEQEQECGGG